MTLLPHAPRLCPICQVLPPPPDDPLCQRCRQRASAQFRWSMLLDPVVRVVLVCGIEGLLGMIAAMLMLIPLALASGRTHASLAGTLIPVAVCCVLVGFMAMIYHQIMKIWIADPARWALAKAGGVGALGLLVGLLSLLGLRLDMQPEWLLAAVVVPLEWLVGVRVAHWQARLLVAPFQHAGAWRRWSVAGWTSASLAHLSLALLVPPSGDGALFFGTALSFAVYGAAAHTLLVWFELDVRLAARVREAERLEAERA